MTFFSGGVQGGIESSSSGGISGGGFLDPKIDQFLIKIQK